jgi:hypothetical protein
MPSLSNNAKHWLDRADEARAVAGQMSDYEAKQVMLRIAKGYEQMAKLPEPRNQDEAKTKSGQSR